MKHQYFGDINDYRKYGLLRLLCEVGTFRTGVCWMLTQADGRPDGKKTKYLEDPQKWKQFDPQLFEFLQGRILGREDDEEKRNVAQIETTQILTGTIFHRDILVDDKNQRLEYFDRMFEKFRNANLIFFDPDNGIERPSGRPKWGNKYSCKFLYWDEFSRAYARKHSVLVYQHFNLRERHDSFVQRLVQEIRDRTAPAGLFSFRTPHVLFLLASQPEHVEYFQRQTAQLVDAIWCAPGTAPTSKGTMTRQILAKSWESIPG